MNWNPLDISRLVVVALPLCLIQVAPLGSRVEAADDAALWTAPKTGMRLVRLPAGSFTMGSPESEPMREEQETSHRVTLSSDFWIGRYEVTQEQWYQVIGDAPSQFADCGADCPVENVSGNEVLLFLERLSEIEGVPFRLPTEAEWEYACRAGAKSAFATGDRITVDEANFDGRYAYPDSPTGIFRRATMPVGSFAPNAWGLFDLHGNVWEWTSDTHCPYPEGPISDPGAECEESNLLVIRGGSWYFGADSMRCALRYTHHPRDRGPSLGFRVARDLLPTER